MQFAILGSISKRHLLMCLQAFTEKHKQERALLPSYDSSRPDVAWKGCPT